MWFSVILALGLVAAAGYCAYEEYEKARYSNDEDAMQKFWKGVGIGVIFVLAICGFLGYKYVNMKSDHYRYHDSKTGREQIQYQGSQEQQQDLKAIDDYASKHKDF